MKKFFSKLSHLGKKAKFAVTSAIMAVSTTAIGLVCSAEESGTTSAPSVTDVTEEALTGVAGDVMGMLIKILPIALGIVGAVIAITFGVKMFKKFTGK